MGRVKAFTVNKKMSGKDMPNWAKALDWSKMVMNKEKKTEVCNAIEYILTLYFAHVLAGTGSKDE